MANKGIKNRAIKRWIRSKLLAFYGGVEEGLIVWSYARNGSIDDLIAS